MCEDGMMIKEYEFYGMFVKEMYRSNVRLYLFACVYISVLQSLSCSHLRTKDVCLCQ